MPTAPDPATPSGWWRRGTPTGRHDELDLFWVQPGADTPGELPGRVWAPRYREHDDEAGYDDVAAACVQFLAETSGAGRRPLIVAGHGSGAPHVRALLDELFDHAGLRERLVAEDPLAGDLAARLAQWHRRHEAAPTVAPPLAWCELAPGRADAGPPIVLLHKLGGWHREWRPLATALTRRDAPQRIIAIDLPGHGESAAAGTGWLQHPGASADAVAELLASLGSSPARLVGASLGGVVALHLAARHPSMVRSLALLGTSLSPPWDARRLLAGDRDARPRFAPGWLPRPGGSARAGAVPVELQAELDLSRDRAGVWVRASERGVAWAGAEQLLDSLAVPVLVVNGELGPYRRHEPTARRHGLPIRVVPGAGAFVHQERPEEVAEHLLVDQA